MNLAKMQNEPELPESDDPEQIFAILFNINIGPNRNKLVICPVYNINNCPG